MRTRRLPQVTQQTRAAKTAAAAIAAAAVLMGIGLAGCGGSSSHNDNSDTQGAQQSLAEGQASLNGLLTRDTTAVTASDIATTRQFFQTAVSKDSGNVKASFGYGLTDLAYTAQVLSDSLQSESRAQSALAAKHGRKAATSPHNAALTALLSALAPGNLRHPSKNLGTTLVRATVAAPFTLAGTRSSSSSRALNVESVRLGLTALRSALNDDLPRLEKANTSGFSFVVADPSGSSSDTIAIDQADVQYVVGVLHGLRAVVDVALAYDFDYGTYNADQTIGDKFGNLAAGSTVTPDDYLPARPFGTLTSSGKSLFGAAKNDLLSGIDLLTSFGTTADQRATTTGHLLPASALDNTARTDLAVAKGALNGPLTMSGVTYNVSKLFSDPPTDVREFLPTYTMVNDGNGYPYLSATHLPDPTFGGIVSGSGSSEPFDVRVYSDDPVLNLLTALGG